MGSRSALRWMLTSLFVILLALAIPAGRIALFAIRPASPGSAIESTLLVQRGTGPTELARNLEKTRAVSSARDFVMLGRLLRKWGKVRSGEYAVSSTMTPLEIFSVLSSGKSIAHAVTVREGENMYEVAGALERAGLASRGRVLELCRDRSFMDSLGFRAPFPPSLEGYLFPETYSFTRVETPEQMLGTMVRKYRSVWAAVESKHRARIAALGLNEHQIITLASIIEKETGAPEERPLISSVFHNRLGRRMRLQSDPTTIYGIWERYSGNLHRQDLLTPTPFNTYTVAALPVGPIGNPGLEAIEAAIRPSESEYLYFVSMNEGRHWFSKTLQEHNGAVRKFQLDPKAREGRSWRQLNRSKN